MKSSSKVPAWMMRSKYYMLEFIAALVGVTVTIFLLDWSLFMMARYAMDGAVATASFDRMNVNAIAMLLVWVPVALLFYKRSRFEELNRPLLATTKLRRFFLYVFMLIMLIAAIAFTINVLYGLLLLAFGASTVSDTLVQQTIPALVGATLHAYVFRTFMRTNSPHQINQFASFVGSVSLIVLAALVVITGTQARGALIDDKISGDLQEISRKIDLTFQNKTALPASLNDLELTDAQKHRAGKYQYKYEKAGLDSYRLCAQFKTKRSGLNLNAAHIVKDIVSQPALYPDPNKNFEVHEKGTQCFNLVAAGSVMPSQAVGGMSSDGSGATDSIDWDTLFKNQSSQGAGTGSY